MGKMNDLTGQRFGRLIALYPTEKRIRRRVVWHCKCDCGKYKDVDSLSLIQGDTTSCGCFATEILIKRNTTHGDSSTRLYRIFSGMISRCKYPSATEYEDYGGRGITVCDEWKDYNNFKQWAMSNGYTDELTLERNDVNGNYCPNNCKWVTMNEQSNNKRSSHFLTYNGMTKTIAQWADLLGINYGTLQSRINKLGWSVEDALEIKSDMNSSSETED